MAMTILNNSAANLTLGELNKNINKVGKQLSKVSSGQKIVYAGDDASGYGISEGMRAKIRSLEQDVKNVQNGSSMLKVALGGIQEIVDELRELKELAINAANDSNTDEDRAAMQKVLKQKQENIDQIATTTSFNSKTMLDGTYQVPHWDERYVMRYDHGEGSDGHQLTILDGEVMKYLYLEDGEDVTGITSDHGKPFKNTRINVIETLNSVKGIAGAFEAMHNPVRFKDGTISVETKDTALYSLKPMNIQDESAGYIIPDRNFIRSSGGAPMAIKLDFSGAYIGNQYLFDRNGYTSSNDLLNLNGQGFSLLFSDSSRNVTLKFDTNLEQGATGFDYWNMFQSETSDGGETGGANTGDIEYTIGLAGLMSSEGAISKHEFSQYVYEALRGCLDRQIYAENNSHQYDLRTGAGTTLFKDDPDGNSFILSQKHNLRLAIGEDNEIYLTAHQQFSHSLSIIDSGWLGRNLDEGASADTQWWKFTVLSKSSDSSYRVASIREKYVYDEYIGNPLWIQHGDKSGQHINLYINDMHNAAMMTDAADVTTKDRATASIDFVDVAIEYALNEATNVGAYLERMDYTESNVVLTQENTQSAESTIRDADMAKEMTEYTKFNVLSQASQSMLAQANQSMSGVLSLLS